MYLSAFVCYHQKATISNTDFLLKYDVKSHNFDNYVIHYFAIAKILKTIFTYLFMWLLFIKENGESLLLLLSAFGPIFGCSVCMCVVWWGGGQGRKGGDMWVYTPYACSYHSQPFSLDSGDKLVPNRSIRSTWCSAVSSNLNHFNVHPAL